MFRRRRRADTVHREATEVAPEEGAVDPAEEVPTPPGRPDGPWDISEVPDPAHSGRVDLGGIWLPGRPGMELRVEVDQQTQKVASIAAILGKSALQVQAFAAPRREGIWDEVRTEIADGVRGQGGRAEEIDGPLGTELRAQVPVRLPDGTVGAQSVRFVGIDGPRWFLRGVISGEAYADEAASATLMEIFRGIIVVRGGDAMAPREQIPLTVPRQPAVVAEEDQAEVDEDGPNDRHRESLDPFERGPEITEVR